jgi:hypothetical protein
MVDQEVFGENALPDTETDAPQLNQTRAQGGEDWENMTSYSVGVLFPVYFSLIVLILSETEGLELYPPPHSSLNMGWVFLLYLWPFATDTSYLTGNVEVLWADAGEKRIPKNILRSNPYYPVANATEALMLFWFTTTRPTQKDYRQLLRMLKHPDFSLADLPTETALVKELPQRLPLIPGYIVKNGWYSCHVTLNSMTWSLLVSG